MKTRFFIIIGITILGIGLFSVTNNGHDLFHYMNLPYEWHDSFGFTDTNVVRSAQCASEELAWWEPCIDTKTVSDNTPEQLEEIEGYAIDYDGDVKHLPFADVCTNEMKIILLTHSNLASTDEEFAIKDVGLPFGMNSEDFERCILETSFTKERSNMVPMEKSESHFSQRYHLSIYENPKTMMQYVTPDFITIGPGEQVTWSNYDKIPVTINSNDPDNPWSTGVILPDEYATLTFEENGIYEYHGRPGTNGIIVVDDSGQLYSDTFGNAIGHTSPITYKETSKPVLLYDNCERYVYWLNEHGQEDIHVPEDYPRYPPWGNQIFPLAEYCLDVGSLIKSSSGDNVKWRFEVNEN